MDFLNLLLDVVLALGAALSLGLLAGRLGQSPIIGYLLAGLLIGPGALGLVRSISEIHGLAEIGVALLLFTIGLELSWHRLRSLGILAAAGGALQIGLTGLAGAGLAMVAGASVREATLLGMILALSSTAVVFRVLADRAEIDSVSGRIAVGILLAQDVAVVPLLVVVPILAGVGEGDSLLWGLGGTAVRAGLLIGAMLLVTRLVIPVLLHAAAVQKSRELFVILALTFCLAATWAADTWELSPVLGAFLAGVLLADSRYAPQIRADVGPLRAAFVALFFVSIGMLADPGWIARNAVLVAAAVAAIVIGKAVVAAGVVRLFSYPTTVAVAAGFTLAQIGELSFVIAELGQAEGLIGARIFNLVVSASVITLLLTPYLIGGAQRVAGRLRRGAPEAADDRGRIPERRAHVIVVGCGPTGVRVVEALRSVGTPHLVIELNPRTVEVARERGFEIEYGDATHQEILHAAGIETALALVVTVPDSNTAAAIVAGGRALRADLLIVARARYNQHARALADSGADVLLNEEEMMGEKLAAVTLRLVGLAVEGMTKVERPVSGEG